MTCTHVLGLIDAVPFAHYSRAHIEAAWQHARGCPTCGLALEAAATVTTGLAAVPEPTLARNLTPGVLARIKAIELQRAVPAAMEHVGPIGPRPWPAWVTALGGLMVTLVIAMSMRAGRADALEAGWLGIDWSAGRLVEMPAMSARAVVLAGGLLLYVAGLFAPPARSR